MRNLTWKQAKDLGWATPTRALVRIAIIVIGFIAAWPLRHSLVGVAALVLVALALDHLYVCWSVGRMPAPPAPQPNQDA